MKDKKGIFVKASEYAKAIRVLTEKGISYTSEYGIFHFDLVSLIIGLILGIGFGALIF